MSNTLFATSTVTCWLVRDHNCEPGAKTTNFALCMIVLLPTSFMCKLCFGSDMQYKNVDCQNACSTIQHQTVYVYIIYTLYIYIYCKGPPTWSIECLHFKGAETCLNTWRTMWFFPMMLLFLLRDREEQFESPCRSLFGFSLRRLLCTTQHIEHVWCSKWWYRTAKPWCRWRCCSWWG